MNEIFNKILELDGVKGKLNEPLAAYTTIKVGGPADLFVDISSIESLKKIQALCRENNIPLTILGFGSNVVISDSGIRGVVARIQLKTIAVEGSTDAITVESGEVRFDQASEKSHYSIADLEYDESDAERVAVEIGSGVIMPGAIVQLINQGITGLQWFSGIPGTLGGWIYNNVHGANKLIGNFVESVTVLDENGEIRVLPNAELEFAYDYSRFHKTKEIILSARLVLFRSDKERAMFTAREWANRKKIQPQRSAGCMWQNLSQAQKEQLGFESTSMGYVIDQKLGLSGYTEGKSKISERHAAFIETESGATAAEIKSLMDKISSEMQAKYGIKPKSEVFFLGFKDTETTQFV